MPWKRGLTLKPAAHVVVHPYIPPSGGDRNDDAGRQAGRPLRRPGQGDARGNALQPDRPTCPGTCRTRSPAVHPPRRPGDDGRRIVQGRSACCPFGRGTPGTPIPWISRNKVRLPGPCLGRRRDRGGVQTRIGQCSHDPRLQTRIRTMRKSSKPRCEDCGGPLRGGRVTVDLRRGEALVVVRNVPADACSRCGWREFKPEVVDRLTRVLEARVRSGRRVSVPVVEFEAVA